MPRTCPHCGAELSDDQDERCPVCRSELPPPPPHNPHAQVEPPPDEDESVSDAREEGPPDERTVLFWRMLFAVTPKAYVTQVLVAANVIVFVLMALTGVSATNPSIPDLIKWGANFGPKTLDGQWWRLFTCMFLHIGVIHIALNMWVLSVSGRLMERMLGNTGFLLLYVISGLGGSLASLVWNPLTVSAGASGAIFGGYGALLGLLARQRQTIPPPALNGLKQSGVSFVVLNGIIGLSMPNIDMAAHAGGFVTGFLCGLVLSRPYTPEGVASRRTQNIVVAVLGVAAIVVGALWVSTLRPNLAGVDRDLENCEAVDKRARDTYNAALQKSNRREISEAEFANVLERDVLPDWREARLRLASHHSLPAKLKAHVDSVLNYMQLREDGWTLMAQAMREQDGTKMQQANEKQRLAAEAGKKIAPP